MKKLRFVYSLLFLWICSSCSSLYYYPDRNLYVKPENFNFTYSEVTFHAKDGTELIGWFFPSKTKEVTGTIIHFHGNSQNMSAHFLGLSWVMDRGFNLFVFDYRGYGISDGKPTPSGVHQDAMAALDEGRRLWSENGKGKFITYGQSLGGAVLMRALEDYAQIDKIDLVVQDGTFMSYQGVAFHKLSRSILFFLSPLAYVLFTDQYSSEKMVKKIKRPVLVIVAEKDNVVPPKLSRELYQTLETEQKWLWEIPNGTHITTFHDPKGPNRDRFVELVESLNKSPTK